MDTTLADRVTEVLEAGGGEPLQDGRFLPLITLESGARIGLDANARWIIVTEHAPQGHVYSAEQGLLFYEALEVARADFDTQIDQSAQRLGLPADDVVLSFPATSIVKAVLSKGFAYMTRLALLWLRTTELRELRPEIAAIADGKDIPVPIKELARRLVVPE